MASKNKHNDIVKILWDAGGSKTVDRVGFTYSDGRKYVGQVKEGEPEGLGTLTFPDGKKYVGQFKNGQPEGAGTLTLPDGTKKLGEFEDGKFYIEVDPEEEADPASNSEN